MVGRVETAIKTQQIFGRNKMSLSAFYDIALMSLNYLATTAGWALERAYSYSFVGETLAAIFFTLLIRRLLINIGRGVMKHVKKVLMAIGAFGVIVTCWKLFRV